MSTALVPAARSLSTQKHYDCVVIGAQLGGQLAAALLAKRGLRVLVLDHDGLGEGYVDSGFVLPYGPALIPPLKSMPAAEQAFGELGMHTDLNRLVTTHDPEMQVLLPGHRFELVRDPTTRTRELSRDFSDPAAADALWRSFAQSTELAEPFLRDDDAIFPAQSFMERWKLNRKLRNQPDLDKALAVTEPEGHPLAAVARGLAPFLSHLHQEPLRGLALSRAFGLLTRGPQKVNAGREGLRLLLQKRIRELGGDVLGNQEKPAIVEELEVRGTRVSGVRLVGGEATYVGRIVISATDTGALRRLLPPQARKKRLAEQLDAVKLRRFLLAVNLVVDESQLPLGLANLGVLLPSKHADSLGLLVYEVTPTPKAGAKSGTASGPERTVCVGALMPAQARDLGDGHLELLAHQLRDAMLEVMPFAKPKLVSVPMLAKGTTRGSRLSPHPIFEIDEPAQLGVSGLAPTTALKNLFLASREVLPGMGLEGELLTGLRLAGRVQGLLKKNDPLAEP